MTRWGWQALVLALLVCSSLRMAWAAPAVTLAVSRTAVTAGAPVAVRWTVTGIPGYAGPVMLVRPDLAPGDPVPPGIVDPSLDAGFFPALDAANHSEQSTLEPGNRLPVAAGIYPFRVRLVLEDGTVVESATVNVTVVAPPSKKGKSTPPMQLDSLDPLTAVVLTANPASPLEELEAVELTATPSGGADIQYKFFAKRGSEATWNVVQDYSSDSTCDWTPTVAEYYRLRVWAKDGVSANAYDVVHNIGYYAEATPLTNLSGSVTPSSPQTANTQVTITATPTGGANLEYKFHVKRSGESSFTVLQGYAAQSTCAWTPTQAGYYLILIYCREVGSTAYADKVVYLNDYVDATPLTGVAVSGSPAAPQPKSYPITLIATPTGGYAVEYQFYAKKPNDASFSLLRDYSTTPTHTWTPTDAVTYTLRVNCREVSNTSANYSHYVQASYQATTGPHVALTAPVAQAVLTAYAEHTLTAEASDVNGAVTKVEFFDGTMKLGEATAAPYTYLWTPVSLGTHILTARATDNDGLVTASLPVPVLVNDPPSVWVTAPANGESFFAPAAVELAVEAEDSDGTVVQVAFYQDATLLGTDTAAPFNLSLADLPAGPYDFTAVATDDRGATASSEPIHINVTILQSLWVAMTVPGDGQVVAPGTNVTLTATAEDFLGTVTKVEFFKGATKLGEATTEPYTCLWTAGAVGSYSLTAVATNAVNETATSEPVVFVVDTPPTAVADAATTDEDTAVTVNVLTNDVAANGQGLTVVSVTDGAHGRVTMNANQTVEYAPELDWHGSDAFTYTVRDTLDVESTGQVVVTVNTVIDAPRVTLASPVNGAEFGSLASLVLKAAVACPDGTVTNVEFFQGAVKLGEDAGAPYSFTWNSISEDTYVLTAVVTGTTGQTTSAPVTITVIESAPVPLVTLTAPAVGSSFAADGAVVVTANPDTTQGTVSAMEFFADNVKFGEDTDGSDGWSAVWGNSVPGIHNLSCRVTYLEALGQFYASSTDSLLRLLVPTASLLDGVTGGGGASSGTSPETPVNRTAEGNQVPTITVAYPGDGTVIQTNTTVTFSGFAHDPDGSINTVTIYDTCCGVMKSYEATLTPRMDAWHRQFTFDSSGEHTLVVSARDNGATPRTNMTAALTFTVYNPAPEVQIVSPGTRQADGTYHATINRPTAVPLQACARDENGTITAVKFTVEKVATGECVKTLPGHHTENSHYWSAVWECGELGAGEFGDYRIRAIAQDDERSRTVSIPVTLSINAAPGIYITGIEPLAHGTGNTCYGFPAPQTPYNFLEMHTSYTITANAFDPIGPVNRLSLLVNGVSQGAMSGLYQLAWSGNLRGNHYAISIQGTGSDGATSGFDYSLILSNPPPVGIMTQPVGTGAYPPGAITLKGYFYDVNNPVTTVIARLWPEGQMGGEPLQQQPMTNDGTPFGWDGTMTVTTPGVYTLELYCQNPHEDIGAPSIRLEILNGATPPAPATPPAGPIVQILSPTGPSDDCPNKASLINPNQIVCTGRALDLTHNLTSMTFTVNGPNSGVWTKTVPCGAGINVKTVAFPDASWTPAPPAYLPLGEYTLNIKATNDQGAWSAQAVPFIVRNLNPIVEIISPSVDATLATPAVVKLAMTAFEYNGFLTEAKLSITNAGGQEVCVRKWTGTRITGRHQTFLATRSFSPGDSLLVKALTPGTYTMTATVTDNEGGTATATRTFTVVNPLPTVYIASPAKNTHFPAAPHTLTAVAIANDANGKNQPSVRFVLRKGTASDAPVIFTSEDDAEMPYTAVIPSIPDGIYSLVAEATDDDGARTVSATITFSVGEIPPPTRRSEPTDGDPVNLLRGEEEHDAPVDVTVYNPSGMHVSFQRTYSSAKAKLTRPPDLRVKDEAEDYRMLIGVRLHPPTSDQPQYPPVAHTISERGWRAGTFISIGDELRFAKAQSCSGGLTPGWTHNYDVKFASEGGSAPVEIRFPNGGVERLIPAMGQDGVPTGGLTSEAVGASFIAQGVPVGTAGWESITLTWADGTRWVLTEDEYCRLTTIISPLGESLKLDWAVVTDGIVGLTQIADAASAPLLTLNFAGGVLTSVVDARQQRTITYTYDLGSDDEPRLRTVSHLNSANPAIRYDYHPNSVIPLLTTVEEPSPITGNLHLVTTLRYNEGAAAGSLLDWKVSSQRNLAGTTRSYVYQDGATQVRVADSAGNLLTRWTTRFDAQGREIGTTDANSASTSITYDATFPNKVHSWMGKDGNTITVAYDTRGNVASTTTPFGTTTSVYGDPTPDAPFGRRLSVQESGKPPVAFGYHANGLLHTITGPAPGTTSAAPAYETVTTSFTYDGYGNLLSLTGPGNDPNNLNATVTVNYNYTQDTFTTDPVGPQAPRAGQPLKVSQVIGGVERSTHLRYTNGQGQLTPYLRRVYDDEGHQTDYAYNIAGQTTSVTLPATGQTGPGRSQVVTEYRYIGGPVTSTTLYNEAIVPGAVRTVAYQYDAEGHLLTRSGNVEFAATTYDYLGRVTAIQHGNWNAPATVNFYDGLGRMAATQYPDGRLVRFTAYDAAGRLTQQEVENDDADIVTELSYIPATGQLAGVTVQGGMTAPSVTYSYNADGTLASMATDGVGTKSYSYDMLGNVLFATTAHDGLAPLTLGYAYYRNGLRAAMQTPATNTPNAGLVSYYYDEAGRPTRQLDPLNHAAEWAYQPNGWLQTQTLLNGQAPLVTTTYGHDAVGRLTSLHNAAPGPVTRTEFTGIGYDGAGNRTGLYAAVPNQPARFSGGTGYTYYSDDKLFQEVSTRGGGTGYAHDFRYDLAGNITEHRTGANPRLYDPANHWVGELVDHVPTYSGFAYDALGNPTKYRGVDCVFDAASHLRQYGTTLSAGYTGDDMRVWKGPATAAPTERTYFLYDGIEPVCELTLNGQGALQVAAFNAFGAGGLYARSVPAPAGGWTTRFYTFDPQGSVAQRLDETGAVLANDLYDVWGALLACRDADDDPVSLLDDPWGYKAQFGYYTDRETDLLLCTTRYYDPVAGRFLTEDPIGYAGGLNLYRYCDNNPVDAADPMGWCSNGGDDPDLDRFFNGNGSLGSAYGSMGATTPFTGDKLDEMQEKLDNTGLIPVVGDAADLLNAGISLARGNKKDALMRAGYALPVAGGVLAAVGKSNKLLGAASDIAKKVPNPWGRKGSPAHQKIIDDAIDSLGKLGWTVTSGGKHGERIINGIRRMGDIVAVKDGKMMVIQVGKILKNGNPVKRERDAINDLMSVPIIDIVWFVPYN